MTEQIRLWFYSLLFMSVVLEGRAPYRCVLAYARVRDERGREMHKSSGNAISFDDAVAEVGADTMRWLYASQPPSRDLSFGYQPARQATRRFLTLWNSYAFFATYAELDGFRPPGGLRDCGPVAAGLTAIDRWLLARAQRLIRDCRRGLDELNLPAVTAALDRYADDLSNWYVRSTRERFWGGGDSPGQTAAYQTLWYALVTAVRCLAPVMPFVADDMWRNLVCGVVGDAPVSVHLDRYPTVIGALDDPGALAAMADARQVAELGPGELVTGDGWAVTLDTTITPELDLEGRARHLVRQIQRLRKDRDLAVTARIDVTYPEDEAAVVAALGTWISQQTLARSLSPGAALDLAVLVDD